jgi:HAD superfamily hydrolase (TIGR01509 family)
VHAVIFDVDGVLVASPHERAWREALHELMATDWRGIASATTYRPDRFTTMLYQQHVAGKPRESGARAILEYFGFPDPAERAMIYARRKQQHIDRLIDEDRFEAYPDAVRFVNALAERDILLGVASSSRNANRFLDRIHPDAMATEAQPGRLNAGRRTLRDAFVSNVCGRDVPRGKPAPDIFLLAAQELQTAPRSCVVVEDATAGIQAAKGGGMRALGVARLNDEALLWAAGADLVVAGLDDVDLNRLRQGHLERRLAPIDAATAS